jgi:hypothetical protein
MNAIRRIRRLAGVLAAVITGLLASAAVATAAFAAGPIPVGDGGDPPPVFPAPIHTITLVTGGGMPGWQITIIAIGAALLGATIAMLLDRARANRRNAVTTAT